ncbi:uncharacterized protein LOC119463717 [Dermacentor silvarum]|uniref:uncharacterized protein LOC119447807 n=1 Tax=Dermacentor silvarum TaxID=543639 RepID=UPI002100AB26|nr:uncharacterized protein LOC119447807 [Dermacentor silvarum]XP_037580470.2 uncharacterized protein LOC119463717 [Dermacentor silvarum]
MERQRKLAALKLLLILKRRRAFSRKYWVRPTWTKRSDESEFFTAMKLMKNGDESLFYMFYRMSPETFDMLHSLVREDLTKEQCPSRAPISSGERLALTLRFLSSGMLVRDAAMAFRVGIETARNVIRETCSVLWKVLVPLYMKTPTEEEWREIATGFSNRWQFPNCLGAVDGKHVQLKCPRNAGSMYFNYKGTHSIVLMAVVDSQYLFRLVDVGAPGRFSDGGIFKDSLIGKRMHEGKLNLPRAATLPRSERVCPHVFVGDEAFQLRPDFMRPLPGSRTAPEEVIFNYRLSRARRCVENAFGILVSRWRIYERQINLEPKNADIIVKATCVLHNFLSSNAASTYCPPGYADFQDMFGTVSSGTWRQGPESTAVFGLEKSKAHNCTRVANAVRQEFLKYFNDEGQVPWQWKLPGVAAQRDDANKQATSG